MSLAHAFRYYLEMIVKFRVLVIALTLAITGVWLTQIGNIKFDNDPDKWSPKNHPYALTTKAIDKLFGGRNFTIIGVVPTTGDIFQQDVLDAIQKIQQGIENIPGAVRKNVLSISAEKVRAIQGNAEGMVVRTMMDSVPKSSEDITRLKKALIANPFYQNVLVAPDYSAAAIVADFHVDNNDPQYSPLYNKIREVADRKKYNGVNIYFGGLPVQLAWFETHMNKMPVYFGMALLIIMLIQYWSFRSFQGMFLPLATALLSVVWGLGAMGMLGIPLDGMNTTTPILIMSVAAGHAIQILKRYYEEYYRLYEESEADISSLQHSRTAIVESLIRVGPVMIAAGVIAVLTFFSLLTFDMAVVRHFGIFAGFGILAALILELTFIPALRSVLPPPKIEVRRKISDIDVIGRCCVWIADQFERGKARHFVTLWLVGVLVALLGILQLRADNSLIHYNKEGSEVRLHDVLLNEKFGGTNSIVFLVKGQKEDGLKDPKALKAMERLQRYLNAQPYVGKTQSIADLIKRMHQAVNGDNPAFYTIPEDRDLIAQYLFLYALSANPTDFSSLVDDQYQQGAIWVYLKSDSTSYAKTLFEKTAQITKDFPTGISVEPGGSLAETIAIDDALMKGKFINIVQMVLVVFLLASAVFRSWIGGLFVVIPLITVVLINYGFMGWVGIPLDMGTATAAAIAIGVGADYEIYLLYRYREEFSRSKNMVVATRNSLLTSGKAIMYAAGSIAAGYAILLVSDFGFYTRLSAMVITTMLVSILCALVFVRALMFIVKPKFIQQ